MGDKCYKQSNGNQYSDANSDNRLFRARET